jgi:hypothetical protein
MFRLISSILAMFVLYIPVGQAAALDLGKAVLVTPPNLSASQRKAVAMLIEEVEKRTQIRGPNARSWPGEEVPVVVVGPAPTIAKAAGRYQPDILKDRGPEGSEGYRIRILKGRAAPAVFVIGNDSRGVLFGAGRLLRELHLGEGKVLLEDGFGVATSPKYPLRGHQMGYRPKTNSYDAWTVPMWEQYIRDLAVFGTNAVELIPPRSDDAATSPHFPLPPMQMMVEMSRLLDEYGLDVIRSLSEVLRQARIGFCAELDPEHFR